MKKIFTLVLLTFFGTGWLFSQNIQLIMSPRPSCYFSDWQNKTETIRMIVNNTSKAAIDCKIKTQLFNSNGEMVGETDFNKMPVLTLQPGISQFNAEDIYPLDAIKLFGNSLSSMLKTGKIPEDNYRLCTDLADPVKGTPLTPAPQCKMFTIVDYQAPVLLFPRDEDSIPEARIRGVIFRWSPVTPSANQLVIYRLQIWEVLDGQTKVDACRNNMPVYEKDLRGVLQTGWPVDFVPAEGQKAFVWSVTPFDDQERKLVTEGYGMAEPFKLSIISPSYLPDAPFITLMIEAKPTGRDNLQQPLPNPLRLEDLNIQLNNNAKEPIDASLRGTVTLTSLADMPTKFTDYTLDGASKSVTITSNADMPTKADVKPFGVGLAIRFILKPFPLPVGTTTITYDDIKTGDVKFSSDEWAKAFGPGGVLPPGDYEICVSVLDKSGKEIGKGCIVQKIIGSDIPNDIAPADGHAFSETDIKKPIIFRWIPVIPKPKDPVTYRLRVWQLMQGQTGTQAMKVNQPIIEKDVDNMTQAVTYITGDFADPELLAFVWNVQASNKEGKLIGESLPSPKGWFGFRIEGHVGTTLTTNDACKDFGVVLMDDSKIWRGDSAFVATSITNKYRGDDPKNKPRSFRIKIQNGLDVEFADNVIKGWTRTPSKFPPGSSSIKWTNNSGDIPNGETKFENIRFANANTGPISVQYEWLNKDDQVLCIGTIDLPGDSGSGSTRGNPGTIKLIGPAGTSGLGGTGEESGEDGDLIKFIWSASNVDGPCILKIVEMIDEQSVKQEFTSNGWIRNKAFFVKGGISDQFFQYPADAPKFIPGKKYAWGVKYGDLLSEYSIFDRWGTKIASPTLFSPTESLPPTSNRPTFEWKMEPALENVSYSITVKELEEGKDIENGVMVLESSNIRENTLPYPKNSPSLDPAKSYGWQVSWFKNGKLMERTPFTRFRFSGEPGGQETKAASICDMLNITPYLQCAGNNQYSFTLTCQNTADPSTTPNGTVTLNTVSLLASNIPITIITSLPISIQPGQTSTISGQLGPVLLAANLKFSIAYTCPTGSGIYSPEITLPGKPLLKDEMTGPASVCPGQTDVVYSVVPVIGGASYIWSTVGAVTITSGLGTNSVTVNFGGSPGSASLCVKAINDCGSSAQNCKSITLTTVPPAPVAIDATYNGIQPNQFTANWTAVDGATGYILEISANPSFMSSETRIVGAVNSYLVTGLTSNTACPIYNYRVTALNACGSSAISNVISVNTFQTIPHGSWTRGVITPYNVDATFTYGVAGTQANIIGCPGQVISLTMEVWGGGGGGGGGVAAIDPTWLNTNIGPGGTGGGGGGGGGYRKETFQITIPSTGALGFQIKAGAGGRGGFPSFNVSQGGGNDGEPSVIRVPGGGITLEAEGGTHGGRSAGGQGGNKNWNGQGQDGGNGVSSTACAGGPGGAGGAGGGPGNINAGGNGGHGGYQRKKLSCLSSGNNFDLSSGLDGGDGKVVFTW